MAIYILKYWRYIAVLLAVGAVWLHGHSMGSSGAELACQNEKNAAREAVRVKEIEYAAAATQYESTIAKQSAQIRANQKRLSNVVQKSYFGCVVNSDLVGLWNENYGIAAKPAK